MTLLDSQRWVESSKTTDAATPVTLWDFSSLRSTAVTSDTLPSLSTSIEVNHRSCDFAHSAITQLIRSLLFRIRVGITVRFIVGIMVRIRVGIRVRITVRITVEIQFLELVLQSASVSGLQSGLGPGLQIFSGLT